VLAIENGPPLGWGRKRNPGTPAPIARPAAVRCEQGVQGSLADLLVLAFQELSEQVWGSAYDAQDLIQPRRATS
jgi:hypothetical protein